MKIIYYVLKNISASDGSYVINGEYKPIYPNETLTLNQKPTTVTSNVVVSTTVATVEDKMKKSQKVSVEEKQGE